MLKGDWHLLVEVVPGRHPSCACTTVLRLLWLWVKELMVPKIFGLSLVLNTLSVGIVDLRDSGRTHAPSIQTIVQSVTSCPTCTSQQLAVY